MTPNEMRKKAEDFSDIADQMSGHGEICVAHFYSLKERASIWEAGAEIVEAIQGKIAPEDTEE